MPKNIYDNNGNKIGEVLSQKETADRKAHTEMEERAAARRRAEEKERERLEKLKVEDPEAYRKEMRFNQILKQAAWGFCISGCLGFGGGDVQLFSGGGVALVVGLAVGWIAVTAFRLNKEGLL